MATFRSNPSLLVALFCFAALACNGVSQAAAGAPAVAPIQMDTIEHVTPRRDYVGPHPTTLEWTAVAGAESYAVTVENEIELVMLEKEGLTTTSMPWPKEVHLEPGTYFWRITALKGNRILADSGRAAFVVHTE
jgi:hypothetical protein